MNRMTIRFVGEQCLVAVYRNDQLVIHEGFPANQDLKLILAALQQLYNVSGPIEILPNRQEPWAEH